MNYMSHQPRPSNAVAYCHNQDHKGYLSPNLIKCHNCISKNCKYLEKYEEKTFWIKRELTNILKKYNKKEIKKGIQINDETYLTTNIDRLISIYKKEWSLTNEKPTIQIKE